MTAEDLALAGICADAPFGPCDCGICQREAAAVAPSARRWHTDRPWPLAVFAVLTAMAVLALLGCQDFTPNINAAKRAFPGADAYAPMPGVQRFYFNLPGVPIEVRTGDHYFVAVCHEHACTRVESAAVESD